MKSLAVAWFMVSIISFVHGINVKSCTRFAILEISQSSQYETITGKSSPLSHANLVMISNSLAQILREIYIEIMFLQDATMIATPHVVTVTSPNSLHFVFYAVRKILRIQI